MHLRIAVPEIPAYIEKEADGNLKGPLGYAVQNLYQTSFKNSTFLIAALNGDSILVNNEGGENGSTFGEILLRNEADILGLPVEYGMTPTFLSSTPQIAALPGAVLHSPQLSTANQEVLRTLNIFSIETIGIILVSLISFGLFFVTRTDYDFLETCSSLARSLINQTNFDSQMTISKSMIFIWLIASFALLEIYEQAMNADMVSLDYSFIVNSVGDLDRHKSYRPVFIQGEYIREQFRQSKDPVKKRIWSRQNKQVFKLNMLEFVKGGQENDVLIAILDTVVNTGEYICGMLKVSKHEKPSKCLIRQNGFGVANVAIFYRANLEETVKSLIWLKTMHMAAGGHASDLSVRGNKIIKLFSSESNPSCLCYAKEELYEDVETLGPIRTNNMAGIFKAYFILLATSAVVFLFERQINGLNDALVTNVVNGVINVLKQVLGILIFTIIFILQKILGLFRYFIGRVVNIQV